MTYVGHQDELGAIELRYCYLCDESGPHFESEVEGMYLFQCGVCFASHSEPLPSLLFPAPRSI